MDIKTLIEKNLISRQMRAIYDYDFILALKDLPLPKWLETSSPFRCRDEYLEQIDCWIKSSKLNNFKGLERFEKRHLIIGTTQTFDEAYIKYHDRRLRLFRGEYAYHRRVVKNSEFLNKEPLKKNDYVIVSLPFCSTGDIHPKLMPMLDKAYKLSVPVIFDCAYFGTCKDISFDFSHPAIESVSFSLTKGIGVGDMRSGIRYSNIDDNYPICQHNSYNHTVLLDAKIGLYMMEKFSPDFIPNKYHKAQNEICEKIGITPTKCMHIALGDETYKEFKINGVYNRLGIRELVKAHYNKEITL